MAASAQPSSFEARKGSHLRMTVYALIRRPQPISDSGFGQDELRTFRIGFDLLPELSDIDPQNIAHRSAHPIAPSTEICGSTPCRRAAQHAQQFVLLRRQFN